MKRWDALLLLCGGFSLGIFLGTFFPATAFDSMAIILLGTFALGFSLFGRPFFVRILVFFLALVLGLWLGYQHLQHWENLCGPSEILNGTAVVVRSSIEKSFFQESEIRMEHCESTACPKEKILLRESGAEQRLIGDRLMFSCDLKRPEHLLVIAGRPVAYRMMLASRGIGYLCEKPARVDAIGQSGDVALSFLRYLFVAREKIVAVLERSLPAGEAALSLGMLIGADEGFSGIEKTLFVRTGLTHVTAVSGYNITLIGGLLFFLAIVSGCSRRDASFFVLLGIIVYVLLVGAPASAVRAGVMGSLLLLSLAIGRPGSGFRLWFLTLASMLLWNPLLLRFDIGFELSYLATFALLLYASVREQFRMPKNIVARFFFELTLLSLFVEWLVAPVILMQFGTFSSVSILANVFLVPLVPFIMLCAFLAALFGLVIPGGVFLLNGLSYFFAHVFISGAELLSGIPMSYFSDLSIPPWLIVLWYVVTGYGFWLFFKQSKQRFNPCKNRG